MYISIRTVGGNKMLVPKQEIIKRGEVSKRDSYKTITPIC